MSLSKRLSDLKTGSYGDPLAEFKATPFEMMCNQQIDFGGQPGSGVGGFHSLKPYFTVVSGTDLLGSFHPCPTFPGRATTSAGGGKSILELGQERRFCSSYQL